MVVVLDELPPDEGDAIIEREELPKDKRELEREIDPKEAGESDCKFETLLDKLPIDVDMVTVLRMVVVV
jgi:hypothetical protein